MNIFINNSSAKYIRSLHSSLCILLVLTVGWIHPASSEEATIAVATNFYPLLEKLKPGYEEAKGYTLIISSGSTGHLYAQIKNGAPYDIFLAADSERPALLEKDGLGVAGTRFTYAVGSLALLSSGVHRYMNGPESIREGDFLKLAIANPELAPYGMAAQQTLVRLGLWDKVKDKIVMGENIGQTYSLVHTGNAELGFVSLSQVMLNNKTAIWKVPETYHEPISQQAILLTRAKDNPAARYFLEYLKSDVAAEIITSSGYTLDYSRGY